MLMLYIEFIINFQNEPREPPCMLPHEELGSHVLVEALGHRWF